MLFQVSLQMVRHSTHFGVNAPFSNQLAPLHFPFPAKLKSNLERFLAP